MEDETERPSTAECLKPLDSDGFHALTCLVGGLVIRRHHALRDILAAIGREAGYVTSTEVYEPSWTRVRTNAQGEVVIEEARLDAILGGCILSVVLRGSVPWCVHACRKLRAVDRVCT